MPYVVKIGYTGQDPRIRLNDANKYNTWCPGVFTIRFAVWLPDAKQREKKVHDYLKDTRVGNHEFFHEKVEDMRRYFDTLGGKWWEPQEDIEHPEQTDERRVEQSEPPPYPTVPRSCSPVSDEESISASYTSRGRSPVLRTKDLRNGQKVRHTIGSHVIEGVYNSLDGRIYTGARHAPNLHQFVRDHYTSIGQVKRRGPANYDTCELWDGNQWITWRNFNNK